MDDSSLFKGESTIREGFHTTGIQKLDKLLDGGIPSGYTCLILAVPGSSAEILIKQMAINGTCTYITTEENADEVNAALKRFGWPGDKIHIIDISSSHNEDIKRYEERRVNVHQQRNKINIRELINMAETDMPGTSKANDDYLAVLGKGITNVDVGEMIIVNSLDFFLNQYTQEDVLKTIQASKSIAADKRSPLIFMMTKGIHGDLFERKLETIVDCVMDLDIIQRGSVFDRLLTVKKMRNYAKNIGIARYTIDDSGFVLEMIQRIM